MDSDDPTQHGKWIRSLWDRGILDKDFPALHDFLHSTPDQAQGIVDAILDCPDLLKFLIYLVSSYPKTEEEWAGYRFNRNAGGVGCYGSEDPEPDDDELEHRAREGQRRIYRLIIAYRAALQSRGFES